MLLHPNAPSRRSPALACFVLLLLGCVSIAALRFSEPDLSPARRSSASVAVTETRLAIDVLANVFLVMGRAAIQPVLDSARNALDLVERALTEWLHSVSAAARRDHPAVHRLPGTNPPAS